ncbi:unnamed protein product [Tenebrio molitor]|nr:unnamed protein product [Tenebrio molitor]
MLFYRNHAIMIDYRVLSFSTVESRSTADILVFVFRKQFMCLIPFKRRHYLRYKEA